VFHYSYFPNGTNCAFSLLFGLPEGFYLEILVA
jgi:hypothetical protein